MNKIYCTNCPRGCLLTVVGSGEYMLVEGGHCTEGINFAKDEIENDPVRVVTTSVRTEFPDVPMLSVRTDGGVPTDKITDVMKEIKDIVVSTELGCGDILIEDVAETGVPVIVTSPALMNLGVELINKNIELGRADGSTGGEFEPADGEETADDTDDSGKIGIVRNSLVDAVSGGQPESVLDDLGDDPVGGFVGAAGEAVGVDDPAIDDEDSIDGGRSHIRSK